MKTNKKGFTLTEVLVVIVIIGIIIAIAIPGIVLIRNRINNRLLESKKETILVAAELYAKDGNIDFNDTTRCDSRINDASGNVSCHVFVYELIEAGYVEPDIKNGQGSCSGEHTSNGCITSPVDNNSLNEEEILITGNNKKYVAIWQGITDYRDDEIVNIVKNDENCKTSNGNGTTIYCLYDGENPDNYLYESGIMWRILGVYVVDGREVVKLVSDDTVVWEE